MDNERYKLGLMEGHNEDDQGHEHEIDYDFYDEYTEGDCW